MLNGHRDFRQSKSHAQHVGSGPQLAFVRYKTLTANAPNLIQTKWNSGNRCTACSQKEVYERTARNAVWCNSCCIYIVEMRILVCVFCSTVRKFNLVKSSMLLRN